MRRINTWYIPNQGPSQVKITPDFETAIWFEKMDNKIRNDGSVVTNHSDCYQLHFFRFADRKIFNVPLLCDNGTQASTIIPGKNLVSVVCVENNHIGLKLVLPDKNQIVELALDNGFDNVSFGKIGWDSQIAIANKSEAIIYTTEGKKLFYFNCQENHPVNSIAFGPCGEILLAVGKKVGVFRIFSNTQVTEFNGHNDNIVSIVFGWRKLTFASADRKIVKIWDWRSKCCLRTINLPNDAGDITAITLTKDFLLVGDKNGIVRVYDLLSEALMEGQFVHHGGVGSLSVYRDKVASVDLCGREIKFWIATRRHKSS